MRRKDKQVKDIREIEGIIQKAVFCYVAMCRENVPYTVPMNFGFHDQYLYLHSSAEGHKLAILKHNPRVCVGIAQNTQLLKSKDKCSYTMKYESVLIFGKVEFLSAPKEKKEGLICIAKHYNKNLKTDDLDFTVEQLDKVIVLKVNIEEVTGKKS